MIWPFLSGTLIDGLIFFISQDKTDKAQEKQREVARLHAEEEAREQARLEARYRKEISKDKN